MKLERNGLSRGSVNRLSGIHSRLGGEEGTEKLVMEEVGLESEAECSHSSSESESPPVPFSCPSGLKGVWPWSSERNI